MQPDSSEVAAAFDRRAPTYARNEWHRRSAERLVALAPLRAGDRVLDAGTGTGFAAVAAAGVVGGDGRVIGVDISAGMLREAASAVRASGLTNIELLQADASSLRQFADGSFNAVVCATALLYMPFRRALREWRRLLAPGGIVAFSNMRAGSPRPAAIFRECAASFGVTLPDPTAPLGSSEACRAALGEAGFLVETIVTETVEFSPGDIRMAWESNFGSAAYGDVRRLPAEQQRTLKAAFLDALDRAPEDEVRRAKMLYVIGRR
jgi:ubiquinone/menaquinone biosynthesis C-methylase UbiE